MGGTILFVIILLMMKNTSKDRRRSDMFKALAGMNVGFVALSIILAACSLGGVSTVFAIFCLLAFLGYRNKQKKENADRSERYGWDSAFENTSSYEYSYGETYSKKLPKAQKARRKIITDFDAKFRLFLEEDQIDSIVNSSYFSEGWKRELEAMTDKIETVHQWITGPTDWLRLYLWAFIPQEITSDFGQQKRICLSSFDQAFSYAEGLGNIPRAEMIERVNEKYFCQFDDITFTMALHMMRQMGFKYSLGVAAPVHMSETTSELDELERKYREMGTTADA